MCWLDKANLHHVNHKGLTTFVPWRSPTPELFQSHNSTMNMQSSFGTCHTSGVQETFGDRDHLWPWDAVHASHLLRLGRKGIPSISFLMIRKLSKSWDASRWQTATGVDSLWLDSINNNEGQWWCIVFTLSLNRNRLRLIINDWRHALPFLHWMLWTWTRCFMTSVSEWFKGISWKNHGHRLSTVEFSERLGTQQKKKDCWLSGSACCEVVENSTWLAVQN